MTPLTLAISLNLLTTSRHLGKFLKKEGTDRWRRQLAAFVLGFCDREAYLLAVSGEPPASIIFGQVITRSVFPSHHATAWRAEQCVSSVSFALARTFESPPTQGTVSDQSDAQLLARLLDTIPRVIVLLAFEREWRVFELDGVDMSDFDSTS